jgi:hypothetical protein
MKKIQFRKESGFRDVIGFDVFLFFSSFAVMGDDASLFLLPLWIALSL